MDLVSASPAELRAWFAAHVQRDLASPLGTGAANSREEWEGKIEANGTAVRGKTVCTWG